MARVQGFEPAQSGQAPIDDNGNPVAVGVWGDSTTGVGVFGTSGSLPPSGAQPSIIEVSGVAGHSIEDVGVWGESSDSTGVVGRSVNSSGVLGVSFAPDEPSAGVFGSSTAGGAGVIGFVGEATGVIGSSVRGTGVLGRSSGTESGVVGDTSLGRETVAAAGVLGRSDTGVGVQGSSDTNNGVVGISVRGTDGLTIMAGVSGHSDQGNGVSGTTTDGEGVNGITIGGNIGVGGLDFSNTPGEGVEGTSILGTGVDGFSFADVGVGVRGEGRSGGVFGVSRSADPNAGGIIGQNPTGFAGVFLGKVRVTDTLFKASGGFEIDHPLDPRNKYLRHSFVESPDMLNIYNGNVTTDADGEASVTLPDYFEALNRDFCYQLTVIGQFAQAIVAQELSNNQFTVKTDQPRVRVSWQVTGVRQDRWAVANQIAAEEEKTANGKGRYLHPKLWGQPEEMMIQQSPEDGNQLRQTPENQIRRISRLMPERLKRQVEQMLRGDHIDREELQRLTVDFRQLREQQMREEPPRIDRVGVEEEWRQVRESVLRAHQATPPEQT
jgi:hypothetical protein